MKIPFLDEMTAMHGHFGYRVYAEGRSEQTALGGKATEGLQAGG
jgi:hypothetical protein